MSWRKGIHERVATVLRDSGIRPKRGRVGQSNAIFIGGRRMNASMIGELKHEAEQKIERGVTTSAVERAIRSLAVEETKEERAERLATKQSKRDAEKARREIACAEKKKRNAVAREDAAKAAAEVKNRPRRGEWFSQFTWDGTPRLDCFAEEFFGATPRDSRLFSAFLIGACRRFGRAPGTPLVVNAAFCGVSEEDTEAALRALFEPFFGSFFDGDAHPRHFATRVLGNFLIFVRTVDRVDPIAFEILARRSHDVLGDSLPIPRTFALATVADETPPHFHKIEVQRFDLEAIRTYRAALIGEAKTRALKPIQVDATKRVRAARLRWERDYANFNGGRNAH